MAMITILVFHDDKLDCFSMPNPRIITEAFPSGEIT